MKKTKTCSYSQAVIEIILGELTVRAGVPSCGWSGWGTEGDDDDEGELDCIACGGLKKKKKYYMEMLNVLLLLA